MNVYCVFCKDNGGYFLEKIFRLHSEAESYMQAQGRYSVMYTAEIWEVE